MQLNRSDSFGLGYEALSHLPDPGFFEGAEKLLEMWFTATPDSRSLREISRSDLEAMLKLVKCEIVGTMSNEHCDSYVLSESSLFVFDDYVILKTCGTTTLLSAVPSIARLAKHVCNRREVAEVFYSRKEFMNPGEQHYPHTSFQDEVKYLDQHFDGAAYALGRLNGEMWYVYLMDKPQPVDDEPSQTIEILMTDLDEGCMSQFYQLPGVSAKDVTLHSGIADFLPGSQTDEVVFNPCGYSVNGLRGDEYFTIHITPQQPCSYVSFESNVRLDDYTELINKVLKAFVPGKVTVTLFANASALKGLNTYHAYDGAHLLGYKRAERQFYEFNRYNLNFGYFVRDKEAAESPSDASDADSGHASGYDSAEDELYLHPHPPRVTGN